MSRSHAAARAMELGLDLTTDARGRAIESDAIRRDVEREFRVKLSRGVYATTEIWQSKSPDERFEAFVIGIAASLADDVVFSHNAAAVLTGLPRLGPWPHQVEVTIPPASGGRSTGNVRRYGAALRDDEVVEMSGFLITSVPRTIVDLARTSSFAQGVAVADAALHRKRRPTPLMSVDELAAELEYQRGRSRFVKMRRVAEFASPLSDSVRESHSRVLIHELGFPPPVLQQPWFDAEGHIGDTDFWWPEHDLVGEFDGYVKFIKAEFTRGRSVDQVVLAEKTREDRIRARGPRFARWDTPYLRAPRRLARLLVDAGLPARPRSRYSYGMPPQV
ncbi:hypothetical protein ACFOYW_17970 [Gryllotalpicola reticulitermitis]|uniref:Transcriptional regulator, AbiEi antitoxin, Type IV TA system n=1 Tax=Gryllotalpicola reticulitermitis TaxID=1184153 RepID=A0ABV8QA53_9MICO